jgi:hypothetical protein
MILCLDRFLLNLVFIHHSYENLYDLQSKPHAVRISNSGMIRWVSQISHMKGTTYELITYWQRELKGRSPFEGGGLILK